MKSVSCPNCGSTVNVNALAEGEEQEVQCDHCGSDLFIFVESGELKVEILGMPAEEAEEEVESSDDYNIESYAEE